MHLSRLPDLDKAQWVSLADGLKLETRLFIDGEYVDAANGGRFETVNPATGKVIAAYDNESPEQVSQRVKSARAASVKWKKIELSERGEYMRRLGRVMRKNREEYARLVTEEMGKPIRQAVAEIEKCAWVCDYYADHAEVFLRDELTLRADEVFEKGEIRHALRFTVRATQGYVFPASHDATHGAGGDLRPPLGLRVRLKAGVDLSTFSAPARVVLTAMKRYGLILADNGSDWYVTGAPDPRWDDERMHDDFERITGNDFEVVE